jgi:hypothetical protein
MLAFWQRVKNVLNEECCLGPLHSLNFHLADFSIPRELHVLSRCVFPHDLIHFPLQITRCSLPPREKKHGVFIMTKECLHQHCFDLPEKEAMLKATMQGKSIGAARVEILWENLRKPILERFPHPPTAANSLKRQLPLLFTGAGLNSFGYRKGSISMLKSRFTPLPAPFVSEAMEALFDCFEKETHSPTRAILGFFCLLHIHPFADGNGRVARHLLATELAKAGYNAAPITLDNRSDYLRALEITSLDYNIVPLLHFISSLL